MSLPDANNAITFSEAAKLLPKKNGKSISIHTIRRWALKGYRGVRLSAFLRGGVWFTTPEALEKFQQECTAQAGGQYTPTEKEDLVRLKAAQESLRRKGGVLRSESAGPAGGLMERWAACECHFRFFRDHPLTCIRLCITFVYMDG
jgi:hypothetical protein